jgi:hypothetical protein
MKKCLHLPTKSKIGISEMTIHDTLVIGYASVALDRALIEYMRPDFADEFNARKRDRMGSSTNRAKLRARLLDLQGYICPKCGDGLRDTDTEDRPQWAHLIPATFHGAPNASHAGFYWGNVQVWHTSCNAAWGDRPVMASDLARPELWFNGTTRDLPKISL